MRLYEEQPCSTLRLYLLGSSRLFMSDDDVLEMGRYEMVIVADATSHDFSAEPDLSSQPQPPWQANVQPLIVDGTEFQIESDPIRSQGSQRGANSIDIVLYEHKCSRGWPSFASRSFSFRLARNTESQPMKRG